MIFRFLERAKLQKSDYEDEIDEADERRDWCSLDLNVIFVAGRAFILAERIR